MDGARRGFTRARGTWGRRAVFLVSMAVMATSVAVDASAATSGSLLWDKAYDGPDHAGDYATRLVTSPDGSVVFVTGTRTDASFGSDVVTIARDATTGDPLWTKVFAGRDGLDDQPSDIAIAPDGATVVVTGYTSTVTHDADFVTIAYNAATGSRRWTSFYDGPAHASDYGASVTVSPDGKRVFVAGLSTTSLASGGWDFRVVAYRAATGAKTWAKRHNGSADNDDSPRQVVVSPDGATVFVTGISYNTPTGGDFTTIALDSATGAKRWEKDYGGYAQTSYDEANAIAVNPAGTKVFVTGTIGLGPPEDPSGGTLTQDYATVAYKAGTGQLLWASLYDGPAHGNDQAADLVVRPDGKRIYVTGSSCDSSPCFAGSDQDWATVSYVASTGERSWVARLDGGATLLDTATAIAVDPAVSAVYVTGVASPEVGSNVLEVAAYEAGTGGDTWSQVYAASGGGLDIAATEGTAFALGTGNDIFTIAYAT